jgi:uncharacterized membrane protein YcaP (DUF421 family)
MATILRAAAAYWFLLFTMRVIGRRAVSQMTPFELILMFLIGGMSIQAIVMDDRSLTNAFLAIMTIGMMHVLVAWLKQKFVSFRKIADGTPVIVVEHGDWNEHRLQLLRMQNQDVMAAARQKGMEKMDDIKDAIVERDGSVSIVKFKDKEEQRKHSGQQAA